MYQSYFNRFLNMKPYLFIDEKEWLYIKNTFNQKDIQESMAKVLMTYKPPFQDITLKDAKEDFCKLKGFRWHKLLAKRKWVSRFEYRWPVSDNLVRRTYVGNSASNFFQQKNRWRAESHSHPGPMRTWETYDFMVTSMNVPKINKNILRHLIAIRKFICSQFKPNVAKIIYDEYQAENILDFSAGWGDRLAGFYASEYGKLYVGIDPKTDNHPIYYEQASHYEKWLTMFEHQRESRFIVAPAEEADLSDYPEMFDLIFTSPPYFSTERYSHENTQSWIRYKQVDDWNKKFLHQTIENIWKTLKPGGHMMINISDFTQGGLIGKICDPMNDFIEKLPGSEYDTCIGMEMTKRPNSILDDDPEENFIPEQIWWDTGKNSDGDFIPLAEPIWIWKKI